MRHAAVTPATPFSRERRSRMYRNFRAARRVMGRAGAGAGAETATGHRAMRETQSSAPASVAMVSIGGSYSSARNRPSASSR